MLNDYNNLEEYKILDRRLYELSLSLTGLPFTGTQADVQFQFIELVKQGKLEEFEKVFPINYGSLIYDFIISYIYYKDNPIIRKKLLQSPFVKRLIKGDPISIETELGEISFTPYLKSIIDVFRKSNGIKSFRLNRAIFYWIIGQFHFASMSFLTQDFHLVTSFVDQNIEGYQFLHTYLESIKEDIVFDPAANLVMNKKHYKMILRPEECSRLTVKQVCSDYEYFQSCGVEGLSLKDYLVDREAVLKKVK